MGVLLEQVQEILVVVLLKDPVVRSSTRCRTTVPRARWTQIAHSHVDDNYIFAVATSISHHAREIRSATWGAVPVEG